MNQAQYQALYRESLENPDKFWSEQATRFIDFDTPFTTVFSGDISHARWFEDATLNVSYQCIDRHLEKRASDIAIIWEGDTPDDEKKLSFQDLHDEVCKLANVLKKHGVSKGDRVCVYLPMIMEATISMLACARIGAVHSVVFSGFSAFALRHRINDAKCKFLISTDVATRGGKESSLTNKIAMATRGTPSLENILLIEGSDSFKQQTLYWETEKQSVTAECKPVSVKAEDPLFILYTSGSTGKPKGLVHTTAGYIVYAAMSFHYVFDYRAGEVYWCAADVGWVTGHSYMVYGPLANGATTLMYAGTPTHPTPSRFWQIVDKHQVNILYTAPTALRALMREGDDYLADSSRDSLRLIGSVGEPINPFVWHWYHDKVGKGRCHLVDTWWQTETGGIMISPMTTDKKLKPAFAQTPFFGIEPVLVDEEGKACKGSGLLAIKKPWPGMARTIYHEPERYAHYFLNGYYLTGDKAHQDEEGDFQIIGRADDVLNVSGHRLGSAELEHALCEHSSVAEAAVVGRQHDIKGESLFAFVMLKREAAADDDLKKALNACVREAIGPIATLDDLLFVDELPKTRSGKIMRRILRNIANQEFDHFGDLSTLSNPDVVDSLVKSQK